MKGCEKSGNGSYLLDIKAYLVFFLHELTTKCGVIVAYPKILLHLADCFPLPNNYTL